MNYTENYNLRKPVFGENSLVTDLNYNADHIDDLIHDNRTMLAPAYDTAVSYVVGDIVEHLGKLYKCTGATTGVWDSTKWTQTTLGDEIEEGAGGASALDDLTDVDLTTPADGEVLTYDSASGKWVNAEIETATSLEELTDTDITTPDDGDILVYDETDEAWKNQPQAVVAKTVSGNPITITDGADAPMTQCSVEIQGSQDLHGYSKPWVGGAGKNKLPLVLADLKSANTSGTWSGNDYTLNGITFSVQTDNSGNVTGIKTTGTASSNANFRLIYLTSPTNAQIDSFSGLILNGAPANGSASTYYMVVQSGVSSIVRDYGDGANIPSDQSSYYGADNYYIVISVRNGYAIQTGGITFYPMLRLSTETATFAPYSNICPITGMDEVEIDGCGKNLLDITDIYLDGYNIDSNGAIVTNSSYNVYRITPKENTSYTLSASDSNTENNKSITLAFYDANNSLLSFDKYAYTTTATQRAILTLAPVTGSAFLYVAIRKSVYDAQLESGSTATDYESYKSNSYTINLNGTRYGGTVDAVRGVMRVTHKYVKYVGDSGESWTEAGTSSYGARYAINVSDAKVTSTERNRVLCNEGAFLGQGNSVGCVFIYGSTKKLYYYPPLAYNASAADFKTWLASNNLEVCYELATPIEIPLTPISLRTLSGNNYISTDAKDLTLTYLTNRTQPIIDATDIAIAEHGKKIESIITENLEPLMTASKNYTTGELIIVGDKAYRATANIASGATLTVNTNVVATTIEDEIGRASHSYSTTEQIVGTWIDGSTLYEKVIVNSSALAIGDNSIGIPTDATSIISASGIFVSGTYSNPLNFFAANSNSVLALDELNATSHTLRVRIGSDYSSLLAGAYVYIVIKYKK